MVLKKKAFLYVTFSFLFFSFLLIFGSSNNYFVGASQGTDDACVVTRGGECQWHDHKNPYGSCTINGRAGRIIGGLCNSKPDLDYSCCVELNESRNEPCTKDLGGICIYVSNPNQTSCVVNGQEGTIHKNRCFGDTSIHYRCCVPDDKETSVRIGKFVISPSMVEEGDSITMSWTVQNASSCTLSVGSESEDAPARDTSRSIVVTRPPGTYEYTLSCSGEDGSDSRSVTLVVVPEEVDPVEGDRGCVAIGGVCEWTYSGATSCTLPNGDPGCYISSLCRSEVQAHSEDEVYYCCAPEDWCDGEVDYEKWEDVVFNGDCPFTLNNEGDDRVHCSQGPYTGRHENAVDVRWRGDVGYGSEYFIAPASGCVISAKQKGYQGDQACGGMLLFETVDGITYLIDHAFIFASLQKHYDPDSGRAKVENQCYPKGTALARIALESDNNIIEFRDGDDSCASGPHFHVDVFGVDKCADCHFVDDLGCNLRNPSQTCNGQEARCWRADPPPSGECEFCTVCGDNPNQYCCESDCVIIDGVKQCRL